MEIEFNDGPFSMKRDYPLFLCLFSEKYAARHLDDLVEVSICKDGIALLKDACIKRRVTLGPVNAPS